MLFRSFSLVRRDVWHRGHTDLDELLGYDHALLAGDHVIGDVGTPGRGDDRAQVELGIGGAEAAVSALLGYERPDSDVPTAAG